MVNEEVEDSMKLKIKNRKKKQAKRKKKALRQSSLIEILLERVKKSEFLSDGAKLLIEPPGEVKMSEIILDFAEPILKACHTKELIKKAIALAIIAWNFSFFPDSERSKIMNETIMKFFSFEIGKDINYYIEMLIERKRKYFSKYQWVILDYQISHLGDRLHLAVVSGSS